MARTALTPTKLTPEAQNAVVLASVGAAIDATDSHVVTPPAGVAPEELIVWVTHTTASEKTITIKKGDNPPAVGSSAGDLVLTFAAGNTTAVNGMAPLSSRFLQSDGTIEIDVAASTTGRIAVFYLPRSV